MLTQILPGIREVRGPLASGLLWLLAAWLLLRDDVSNATGEVQELVRLGERLPDGPATAVALFAAYMIGSVSNDVFGVVIGRVTDLASGRISRWRPRVSDYSTRPMSDAVIHDLIDGFDNERGRYEAETELRVALIPRLIAFFVALAVRDNWKWAVLCAALVLALGVQAWFRAGRAGFAKDAAHILRSRSTASVAADHKRTRVAE